MPCTFGNFGHGISLGVPPPVPACIVLFGRPAPSMPISSLTGNVTIFKPSSFFTIVQTGMGLQLQVQLVPLMQVFVRLDRSYQGQMCGEASMGLSVGLCGWDCWGWACPSS